MTNYRQIAERVSNNEKTVTFIPYVDSQCFSKERSIRKGTADFVENISIKRCFYYLQFSKLLT